jgi:hypothetical protein
MARKVKKKTKEELCVEREEKQRLFLEKLGFMQMMFDFYTAPVK